MRRWRGCWRRGAALLALAAALCVRVPVAERRTLSVSANHAALAAALSDFSLLARTSHDHVGSWLVQPQPSNYSSWAFGVTYSCGARCAGAARVLHRDATLPPAPPPGTDDVAHVITVYDESCWTPLPLGPSFCEWSEAETRVWVSAAGVRLADGARAGCALARALLGACAADLRARRQRLLAAALARSAADDR